MEEIKGISFPFRIGVRGGVVMSGKSITQQQHITESIMNIVGTTEAERVMYPFFGLEELDVFLDDLNETTKNMAIFKIREKLEILEPRVTVIDVQITETELVNKSKAYLVDITYEVIDSGEVNTASVTI